MSRPHGGDFYPRSPCGERRPAGSVRAARRGGFLSTLSLRRATVLPEASPCTGRDFYPRSPCGERRTYANGVAEAVDISIHALLAESDRAAALENQRFVISIHALLAESDLTTSAAKQKSGDFYPRSPCGERPIVLSQSYPVSYFYPRSPCGERRKRHNRHRQAFQFLSTLSLRRATSRRRVSGSNSAFLSTLSLRRATLHFLPSCFMYSVFLSTLSLRRATAAGKREAGTAGNFYPRSPCGERLDLRFRCSRGSRNFYPRSPCGERRRSL